MSEAEDVGFSSNSCEEVQADEKPRSGDEDVLWVPEHDGYLVTMDE
jgi:hypothetical protein